MSETCAESRAPGATSTVATVTTRCRGPVVFGLCDAHANEYAQWLLARRHQRETLELEQRKAAIRPAKKPIPKARQIALAKYAAKRADARKQRGS